MIDELLQLVETGSYVINGEEYKIFELQYEDEDYEQHQSKEG